MQQSRINMIQFDYTHFPKKTHYFKTDIIRYIQDQNSSHVYEGVEVNFHDTKWIVRHSAQPNYLKHFNALDKEQLKCLEYMYYICLYYLKIQLGLLNNL